MVRRARPIIRAATGITLAKRVLWTNVSIPDVSAADYDNALVSNLLECTETMDEEVESTGASGGAIADAPLYSRMLSMKFNINLTAATAGTWVRWMLIKRPDGETNAATSGLLDATFHSSDDTQAARELRANTLAKGMTLVPVDRQVARVPIFVKRSTLRRLSPLKEGDLISLCFAKDGTGTTAQINGFGTIWIKANA